MMNVKEYAEDVNMTPDEIIKLCEKLGIDCQDENTELGEEDIILLDNEVQNSSTEEVKEEIEEDEDIYDDELTLT